MVIPCLCSFTALRTLAADRPVAQKSPKPISQRPSCDKPGQGDRYLILSVIRFAVA